MRRASRLLPLLILLAARGCHQEPLRGDDGEGCGMGGGCTMGPICVGGPEGRDGTPPWISGVCEVDCQAACQADDPDLAGRCEWDGVEFVCRCVRLPPVACAGPECAATCDRLGYEEWLCDRWGCRCFHHPAAADGDADIDAGGSDGRDGIDMPGDGPWEILDVEPDAADVPEGGFDVVDESWDAPADAVADAPEEAESDADDDGDDAPPETDGDAGPEEGCGDGRTRWPEECDGAPPRSCGVRACTDGIQTCLADCTWSACLFWPPAPGDACDAPGTRTIPDVTGTQRFADSICGATDDGAASPACPSSPGPDTEFLLELAAARRAWLVLAADGFWGVLRVRGAASCPGAEITCAVAPPRAGSTWVDLRLDLRPGRYRIVIDAADRTGAGPFELTVNLTSP